MGIIEDQKKLRQQNINYLKTYSNEFFNNRFMVLDNHYEKLIKQNVFDRSDIDEVKCFIKIEFEKLNNEIGFNAWPLRLFNDISISNNKFEYDLEEIIEYAISSQLVEHIYPLLEKQLKDFIPSEFINWSKSLKVTTEKVFLKHLLDKLRVPKSRYNNKYGSLFNDYGFELFEYLNDRFDGVNAETVKFTIIYHFLNQLKYYKSSKVDYYAFVRPYLKTKVNFKRMDFDLPYDKKYTNHKLQLTSIYDEFKETHNL